MVLVATNSCESAKYRVKQSVASNGRSAKARIIVGGYCITACASVIDVEMGDGNLLLFSGIE